MDRENVFCFQFAKLCRTKKLRTLCSLPSLKLKRAEKRPISLDWKGLSKFSFHYFATTDKEPDTKRFC